MDQFTAWQEGSDVIKVLLFSTKGSSPLYKSLSLRFKDRIEFGLVVKTGSEIAEHFDISDFPSLLVLPVGEEAVPYKGELALTCTCLVLT